ncbi:MAG: GIY-YIG nuclease family protein [Candidatus Moranbacteria bacterium]|nr:GIY-YIG nuclease family protein [Candidatus Moranbacteria bacterium]
MFNKSYCVYILASGRNGTLYTGVTNNLLRRVWQHKKGTFDGFTKKYKVHMLVYYESTENIISAIEQEKRIKVWKRKWKLDLIEKNNPQWKDLFLEIAGEGK